MDKGNQLAEEVAGHTEDQMNYFFGMKQRVSNLLNNNKRMALHIMHRLSQITRNYGQEELAKKYENIVNNNISSMRGNMNQNQN